MNENNQPQSQQTDINRLQFEAKLSEFISSQQSIPPDIAKVVRERFWDLIEDTRKVQPSHSPTEQPGRFSEEDVKRFNQDAREAYDKADTHHEGVFAVFHYATMYERSKQANLVAWNQKLREYITAEREISQRFTDENAKLRSELDKMREENSNLKKELQQYHDSINPEMQP